MESGALKVLIVKEPQGKTSHLSLKLLSAKNHKNLREKAKHKEDEKNPEKREIVRVRLGPSLKKRQPPRQNI